MEFPRTRIICADPDGTNRRTLSGFVESTFGEKGRAFLASNVNIAERLIDGPLGREVLAIIANVRMETESDGIQLVRRALDAGIPHGAVLIPDESLRPQIPADITAVHMGKPNELIDFLKRALGPASSVA